MAQVSGSESEGFAGRLSLALKVCNLSRTQLSATLGVHKSLVSRWLSGRVTPTSYNLARISAVFANLRPGFNMTVWTAPRAEFEAALGLRPASPVTDTREDGSAVCVPPAVAADSAARITRGTSTRSSLFRNRIVIAGTAAIVLVIASSFLLWHENVGRDPTRAAASQSSGILQSASASVAVLPFLNMSGDPTKEYLGDGISEEISNDLANTPNLRVAARTSSFSFKGKDADIAEIARKLHVRAVLEGSVREEGSRVRIIAQLINAGDGFHLWSARYDRSINDILAVQDEIARSIVAALTRKLLSRRDIKIRPAARARGKINPGAYNAYLQGRFFMDKRDADDMLRAAEFFKQAIRLEPKYADAHASLALTYERLLSNGQRRDTLDSAKREAATALLLDPGNFSALLADAQVKRASWNWSGADAAMRKLLKRYPNNAEIHHFYAVFLEGLAIWDRALTEQRRAAELDPLSPIYRDNVGQALHFLHRNKEAIGEVQRALLLEHDYEFSLGTLCACYADTGQLREARQILHNQLMPMYAESENTIACASTIAYREHNEPELRKIAQFAKRLYTRGVLGASYVPFPYAFMGDYEGAARWLEKAYDDRDYGVFYLVREPDVPAASAANARWQALLKRPAFRERERVRAQILTRDRKH